GGRAQSNAELSRACSLLSQRVHDAPEQDDELLQLALLAGTRHDLGGHHLPYPTGLPGVFAALGYVSHGVGLARNLIDTPGVVQALATVVTAAAEHSLAPAVAEEALSAFRSLNTDQRAHPAPFLAEALAAVGRHEEALELIEGLEPSRADDVLRSI